MKVRKKNLCHTCRKRKLQCDGKVPSCSQCRFSKRDCEGYPEALFVPFVSTNITVRSKRTLAPTARTSSSFGFVKPPRSKEITNVVQTPAEVSGSSSQTNRYLACDGLINTREMVSLILSHYVPSGETGFGVGDSYTCCPRICGSWVTALPELTCNNTGPFFECLQSAINTLASSIIAYRSRKDLVQSTSTQYEHSIRHLMQSLAAAGSVYKNELVAAVMCLALSEALFPIRPLSWLVHVEGVSKMIQLSSPEFFTSGIEHTLFIGFRPLLILKAIIFRKATFFANNNWIEKPFQHHRAAPLQDLLGIAARIPGVLEEIDSLTYNSFETAASAARERIEELMEIRCQLDTWHSDFLNSTPAPLYWRCTSKTTIPAAFESLCYRDLSTANVFTYLWSFQLLCLTHIHSLLSQFPGLRHSKEIALHDAKSLRDVCLELSIQIYQSMEYVLQEDFMLYGLSSAHFPLQTACEALESDAEGRAVLATLDPLIGARSRARNV
ncbi:hypothetical protein M3J09_012837 [Ascochyta lentis]